MTRDNNLVYCDNEHLPIVPWAPLLDNGFDQMLLSKKMALAKWFLPFYQWKQKLAMHINFHVEVQ